MTETSTSRSGTQCVHGESNPWVGTTPIVPPIIQSTTYAWSDLDHPPGITYARSGNPTSEALERRLAALEGGSAAVCFSSGLAAIDALVRTLPRYGRIVAGRHLYGGTTRLLERLHTEGRKVEFVDSSQVDLVKRALNRPAALVLVESPSNPTLAITDLRRTAEYAHASGALLAVDNTLLTPLYQRPIHLGADVVIHSTTKYIDGHDATLGGAVVLSPQHAGEGEAFDGPLAARLRWTRKATGAVLAPFEAWLTLQGVKTLHLRTRAQWAAAARGAGVFVEQVGASNVHYPGLPHHPGHEVHRSQTNGDGGLVAVDLGSFRLAREFLSHLRLFTIAENLGATESIVTHPASMTHVDLPPERRREDGISDGLVRLSFGVEDPDDLLEDLGRALEGVNRQVGAVA